MKRLFFWGLALVIFGFITTDHAYAGRVKSQQQGEKKGSRGKKAREVVRRSKEPCEEHLEGVGDEDGEEKEDEGVSIEDYIDSLKSEEEKAALQEAEYLHKIENEERPAGFAKVFTAYEVIAKKYNNGLAYFRLGELSEDKERLGAAYRYYKAALESGFGNALPKLFALGSKLAEIIDGPGEMSEEVRRMFA